MSTTDPGPHRTRLDAAGWQRFAERAAEHGLAAGAAAGAAVVEALTRWSKDSRCSVRLPSGESLDAGAGDGEDFRSRAAKWADRLPGELPARFVVDWPTGTAAVRLAAESGLVVDWTATGAAAELTADLAAACEPAVRLLAADAAAWTAPGTPVRLPDWQERLLASVNDTTGPEPAGLLQEAVARAAESAPERIAVIGGGRRLTYRELLGRARRIGRRLRHLGAVPGSLVAICLDKGWEQPVGILGVLESGAGWVPIAPGLPQQRREKLLHSTETRIVLTSASLAGSLDWPPGIEVLAVDSDEAWAGWDDAPLPAAQRADDLAYVIFTSGSTGEPKGAMIDHRGALNTISDVNGRFGVDASNVFIGLSAMSFDLSVWDVFGALTAGAALVLPAAGAERDPAHWVELVRTEGVTTWMGAPALFEMFCDELERVDGTADSLRLLIFGGDWIPLQLPARARQVAPGATFVSLGGNAEASILSCTYLVDRVDPDWASIPYGKPLTNQTLHVLGPDLTPKPVLVPGELHIGGTGVGHGYWRDPARTAASFLRHPVTGERLYRTGDLARLLPDGNVEFLGREDFQVKVAGHRIELGEIEAALRTHRGVDTAVAIAVPSRDTPGHQGLAAFVVASDVDADDLRALLRTALPEHMVPERLEVVDSLPLTANGKVDRRALLDRADAVPGDDFVPPGTELERTIAGLWAEVLGRDRVGAHDSFFELGGNSLLGIRVMNRLRARLGGELNLHSIFEARTVSKLAATIEQGEPREAETNDAELPEVLAAPGEEFDPFPLTDQQQAYCLGRTGAFSSGNVSAHVYLEYEGDGVDLARFERAWRRVIQRHPMLRAVIDPATMTQRVLPEVPPYEIAVADLRGLDADGVAAGLAEIRDRLSHEVRPVDRWPLHEVAAAVLDDRVRVCFSVDALCSDFASLQVVFADLTRYYADPGRDDLPALRLSYRDYVRTAGGLADTETYRSSAQYWAKRLAELPPAPRLPMVRTPESVSHPRFARRSLRLPDADWQQLRRRAGAHGMTPAGLLLAAYAEVLGAWSAQEAFSINVTNLNRLPLHEQVTDVVGEFASFTLLAVEPAADDPFLLRAQRIQQQLWADLDHSTAAGVRLLRELMRQRGGYDEAMMPVVFTSTVPLAGGSRTLLDGLLEPVGGITQTPQVWMDLLSEEQDGDLVVNWDVVEELFPPGLPDDMFAALSDLLRRLAADESTWRRADLGLDRALPEDAGIGAKRAVSDRLVPDLFADQAAEHPDRVAVIAADRTLTYRELDRESRRIAAWLRERGARPNRLVGIVLERGWEQVVAAYATLFAGAAYLPIDPELPAARIAALLDRGEVELVLTQQRLDRDLPWPTGVTRLCVDGPVPEPAGEAPEAAAEPGDLAYVLFTSGSTGEPKGVMVEHRGLVNALRETIREFGIGPDDRCLALTALHHDMSAFDLFGMLGAGGTVVVPEAGKRREAAHWAELIAEHRVTVWNSVPAMMEMLLEHTTRFAALRLAFLGGDWIPLPVVSALTEPGVEVVSVGGPTETTLWNIWHRVTELDPQWRSVPYGRPIANTRYHILGPDLRDCPAWVVGEMYCSGLGLARGYWRAPEVTAAAFTSHPRTGERLYRTGDRGRFRPDGTIEFIGRADHQVQVRGYRIEPAEVEAALLAHPGVRSAVVTGQTRTSGPGHRGLLGYVVPEAGEIPAAELREHLRNWLPEQLIPAAFVSLDRLPLNANGKVDRRALPVPDVARSGTGGRPTTALTTVLGRLWAQACEVDAVDVHDNFFELGGDSVVATRIVTRLRHIFDEHEAVSLRTLFARPTVAGLAEAMVGGEAQPGRTEALAALHLEIEGLSAEEVDAALTRRAAQRREGA
ncbi:amino acid adenylation domain-containing protein [Saccharopolyspora shandongensis]|uniref:amino acid adenylation domain-containing protein n=1 Tax=Saccharopolyspora shandongensis TaxID=418495 RepID=UPI0033CFA1AB